MYVVAVCAGLVIVIVVSIVLIGGRRFRSLVTSDVRTLLASATSEVGPDDLRRRWDTLPEPVRRYLQFAISPDTPAIRTARMTHDGSMRLTPNDRWLPVEGEEYFSIATPGFVWIAKLWMMPGIWVNARDRLLGNRGGMLVKLLSVLQIGDASGPEIDQGSRLRWLGEAVWFPYGFVSDEVRWDALDGRSARVTLRPNGEAVTAIAEFDADGKLTGFRADRYRDVGGGKALLTPWVVRCDRFQTFGGFRVPTSIDVRWILPEGEFESIRFRVTSVEYNVSETSGSSGR
jgi:hypothetical protein